MQKRHHNPRLAKIHRSYKVDEVASLYGVDKNTVRNWIKAGLQTCDSKRPTLIMGQDLNVFHALRRSKNKRPCKLSEIYCMRCRAPRQPAPGMVEYQPVNEKTASLIGLCPACSTLMYRRISQAKIEVFSLHMGFTLPLADLHIIDSHQLSVNCDFNTGKQSC